MAVNQKHRALYRMLPKQPLFFNLQCIFLNYNHSFVFFLHIEIYGVFKIQLEQILEANTNSLKF